MSRAATVRWNREQRIRAEAIQADLEAGLLARRIKREVGEVIAELEEERQITRAQKELLAGLARLGKDQS